MKDLRPSRGTYYIQRLIAQGEHEHQDFKFAISDARKIARSVSAFANNDGGRLLIGVKDNGSVAGVRSEEDIYVVEQAAEMYCRPAQHVTARAFRVDGGAVVIEVDIPRAAQLPVMVTEADGSRRAYYRVADENIALPAFVTRMMRGRESRHDVMSLDGPERLLLHLLADGGEGLTPRRFALMAHITTDHAERVMTHLYAMGLIGFSHTPQGFVVVASEPADGSNRYSI